MIRSSGAGCLKMDYCYSNFMNEYKENLCVANPGFNANTPSNNWPLAFFDYMKMIFIYNIKIYPLLCRLYDNISAQRSFTFIYLKLQ